MVRIDMELPKSCEDCPCCQPDAHHFLYTCSITGEDVMDDETGDILQDRSRWCPMKEE